MRDSACPQTSGRRPAWKAGIVIAAFVSRVADRFHRGGCARSRWPAIPLLALTLLAAGGGHAQPAPAPTFVPEASCGECHAAQQRAVAGSQHAHAMQPANPDTVLGNFEGATFRKDGVTSRFFRRDGRYFVNTDGSAGRLADYEIRFTFGVAPLQQYLVGLPGGRLQALSIAWDTTAKRWFHTYPNERIDHRDVLHWTRASQNWNSMCAACHAVNVRKGYNADADAYRTTYAALGVGCQSCHGPASNHLAWAKGGKRDPGDARTRGFVADIGARSGRTQVEACAYCHALRATLTPDYPVGRPLLDHVLPVGLDGTSYFNDGQQREEVFVYGSWLQSRMHRKGMVCSDCHDAHTGRTKAPGNALCTSCHNATGAAARPHVDTSGLQRKAYDAPSHTHHAKPIACVDCHAPKRTYMVVDPRLDHAFRIPRPDLSAETGSPNACTLCHKDRDARWAAAAVAKWYGPQRRAEYHYGQAFAAARDGRPGAAAALQRIAADRAQPGIVRAAAIEDLGAYPSRRALELATAALADDDGLVRIAGIHTVVALDPATGVRELPVLLSDPLRAVRVEAARALAPAVSRLPPDRRQVWERVRGELEAAAGENADRPQSWLGLAQLAAVNGDTAAAERALRQALKLEPSFVPGIANLADLMRQTGRDREGEALLREAIGRAPKEAALQEALALSLVRQKRKPEALRILATAHALPAATARTSYLYAVSLADAGRGRDAIAVLDTAARRRGDRDVLLALASFRRDAGDPAGAKAALDRLAAINPGDPALGAGAAR
jgi:predicted CXXCH cytochrome family protein